MNITQYQEPGLACVEVVRGAMREVHLTLTPRGDESLAGALTRAEAELDARGAVAVKTDVFGPCADSGACRAALEPITWVCPIGQAAGLGGVYVWAVSGADVALLTVDGRVLGRVFQDETARYCLLGRLEPEATGKPRPEQAQEAFEALERSMRQAGMTMADLARTWFYNEDILDWYGPFNEVRTAFYQDRGVFERIVPASTGIGGPNPAGAALTAGALAVQPVNGAAQRLTVAALPSPLQCPALDYGSSFSRAVEIVTPGLRRISVSGTASIAPEGQTQFVGDAKAQTIKTIEVVQAILAQRDMDLSHTTRASAYFRDGADAPLLAQCCRDMHLPSFPVILAENTVCRDDLLFELELDAVKAV